MANETDYKEGLQHAGPDLGVAIMLLGSVAFMMAVFYLVNHKDDKIKKYTWDVINKTISIFSSVLVFQACDKNITDVLDLDHASCWFRLLVGVLHAAFWFILGESILYFISLFAKNQGHGNDRSFSLFGLFPSHDATEEDVGDFLEKLFNSYGTLSAHITGFAAIQAFGVMQQNLVHNTGITQIRLQQFVALATTIFAGISMAIVLEAASRVRKRLFLLDGEIEEVEKKEDEQAREVENDVLGITVSFLLVQVTRFVVNGELPNAEGEIELEGDWQKYDPYRRALMLMLTSLVFARLVVNAPHTAKHKRRNKYLKVIWSTSFAWTVYFALQWLNYANVGLLTEGQPAMFSVILALTSTTLAFGMIFFLEKLESGSSNEHQKKHMQSVILSLSILVGFAWERSFDIALNDIADTASTTIAKQCPKGLIVLVLALVLAIIVLPAWYLYILPLVCELEAHEARQKQLKDQDDAHAYQKFEDAHSNQESPRRSLPQPVQSTPLEIPGDQFQNMVLQFHDLTTKIACFRQQRLRGLPQGLTASNCAQTLVALETEATAMNLDLVRYKRFLDDRKTHQEHFESEIRRLRMELHTEYLNLCAPVAAG